MRFLIDQDVYIATARLIKGFGHDVVTASQADLSQASDSLLLQTAQREKRILVTRDKDFGGLVFADGLKTGVIFIRVMPSNIREVHEELGKVLTEHSEADLMNSFLVVEAGRQRVRSGKPGQWRER